MSPVLRNRALRVALGVVLSGVLVSAAAATSGRADRATDVATEGRLLGVGSTAPVPGAGSVVAPPPALPEPLPGPSPTTAPSATPGAAGTSDAPPLGDLLRPPTAPRQDRRRPSAAAAVFDPVVVQRPRLRVNGVPEPDAVTRIRDVKGVRSATAIRVGTVPLGKRKTPVKVAAVRPQEFRLLTPQVTADAVGVWERIVEGDAALTHETGTRLRAELGSTVPAGASEAPLRVGAYASNGVPAVAEALVSPETGRALGLRGRRDVLVALDPGADPDAVAAQVQAAAGADVEILAQPQARRAFLTGADARNAFEPYTYVDLGDGMIQIDPDWVRRNIVTRAVPLLSGPVRCHRLMVDQLAGALGELESLGLGHHIDPSQYGGCWVPRHIDFNPAKPLSMHSWGLAVDLNVSTNGLGQVPQMDPRVVEVFDRWGFVWGGRWSRPDGMHFELGALLDSPQG